MLSHYIAIRLKFEAVSKRLQGLGARDPFKNGSASDSQPLEAKRRKARQLATMAK